MVGKNILHHPAAAGWKISSPSSAELDLTNASAVARYVSELKPRIIVHAAGQVGGIQANIAKPVAFLERNTVIGVNLIMAAHQAGVREFLNLASTCMYPRAAENPLREDSILSSELEPTNEGYALAKIVATRLCQYIRREDPAAQYKTLVPCNLYGKYDKFDPESSHLIPAIIHKIHLARLNRERTVKVWGDGTARREFMFARDLADAVLKAANEIDVLPEIMNCGIGYDYTIKDYYETVADVIGWDGEFSYDLSKPVGMKQKLCSVNRQREWGWCAKTSLRDGIAATYDFYLNEVCK